MSKGSKVKKIAKYTTMAAAALAVEPAMADVITSGPGFIPPLLSATADSIVPVSFGGAVGNVFQFRVAGRDFTTTTTTTVGRNMYSIAINPGPAGSDQSVLVNGGNDPSRLGPGYQISGARLWIYAESYTSNDVAGAAGFWNGATGETVNGFLGVRFSSSALTPGIHYGFFQLSYDNTPDSESGTLRVLGWAYETTAGAPITTFDVSTSPVPEPATMIPMGLGLLALGAAGLRAKRGRAKA